jgi:hypothetical protein
VHRLENRITKLEVDVALVARDRILRVYPGRSEQVAIAVEERLHGPILPTDNVTTVICKIRPREYGKIL